MPDKKRYSDEELEEFRQIINEKLRLARLDYEDMMKQLTNANSNDVIDTSPTYKALEEGSLGQSKEESCNWRRDSRSLSMLLKLPW